MPFMFPEAHALSRKHLTCVYSNINALPSFSPTLDVFFPSSNPTFQPPKFPTVFFLDSALFRKAQIDIPQSSAPIPRYVYDLIGEFSQWRSIPTKFFETVHTFMPIVSKARLFGKLLNPLVPCRGDVALLILSMRIITMLPAGGRMDRTPEYAAAKRFYTELEGIGAFSPQVLQAGVLIALYEYGHAIYPAAYLTIGGLARYGISSGIDGTGPSQMAPPGDWIEAEERKRIWWGVLILDRCVHLFRWAINVLILDSCVNLGNPTRTLATQEPPTSSILPMEDELWDQGVSILHSPQICIFSQ
jgi:Fungal specific transcription factor domain